MKNYDLDNFEVAARIVVIGIGGAGNNAVNRMIDEEISNVEFYVINTDKQALASSKSNHRIVLGESLTNGLGAGGEPEMGEKAAEASLDDIKEIVNGADMVFIAAGMGGGTGTGAAPVVARVAKDSGALVVAIVTRPFTFEGQRRIANSIEGLNKLKGVVDSLIVVSNDKLLMFAGSRPISEAFNESDKVLAQSVKTIVNIILLPAFINRDFADVRNTLKDKGLTLISFGVGRGPNKARDAANNALNSPLLEVSIKGARKAIVLVTCGSEVTLFDAQETVNFINDAAGNNIDVKLGMDINDNLNDELFLSIIATDFIEQLDFETSASQSFVRRPHINENKEEVKKEEEVTKDENIINDDDILPDFLKSDIDK